MKYINPCIKVIKMTKIDCLHNDISIHTNPSNYKRTTSVHIFAYNYNQLYSTLS